MSLSKESEATTWDFHYFLATGLSRTINRRGHVVSRCYDPEAEQRYKEFKRDEDKRRRDKEKQSIFRERAVSIKESVLPEKLRYREPLDLTEKDGFPVFEETSREGDEEICQTTSSSGAELVTNNLVPVFFHDQNMEVLLGVDLTNDGLVFVISVETGMNEDDFWLSINGKPMTQRLGDYAQPIIVRTHIRGLGGGRKRAKKTGEITRRLRVNHLKIGFSMNIIPDEVDADLCFFKNWQLNAAANTSMSYAFQSNAAWDVDPAVGSGNTMGLAAWSTFYSYYRVYAYTYEIQVSNQDLTATTVSVVNCNFLLAVGAGHSILTSSFNAYSQHKLIAASTGGACTHTFKKRIMVAKLVGGVDIETGDMWRGVTGGVGGSVPSDLVYNIIGLDNVNNLTNGCIVFYKLTMHMRLYDRKVISS